MSYPTDPAESLTQYAHPEALVTTEWLAAQLGSDGNAPAGLVVVECDEDVLLYEMGHISGAVKLDWHTELNDPVVRDYVSDAEFARLMSEKGINREDTVVLYGDKNNWWATYALWVFKLFGHDDVRILDGGRDAWIAEGREMTTDVTTRAASNYPVTKRDESKIRAFKEDTLAHIGKPMIDVRSPEEYSGERTHMPAYPEEGALRGGHIPGASSMPWSRSVAEDGRFRSRGELEKLYFDEANINTGEDVIVYCRIGERSSHTWFVLTYLLGMKNVRNYDGSWTEWGSAVRVPIHRGADRGSLVA